MRYNPTVQVTSDIDVPSPPSWSRKTFTRINYSSLSSFVYDGKAELFLSNVGGSMYLDTLFPFSLKAVEESDGLSVPLFFSNGEWSNTVKYLSSMIITPQNSLIPRPMVPEQYFVGNGCNRNDASKSVFNWELKDENNILKTDSRLQTTSCDEAESMMVANNSVNGINTITLSQNNVACVQTEVVDVKNLIGGGAFQLAFTIYPIDSDAALIDNAIKTGKGETPTPVPGQEATKKNAKITITIGKLKLIVGTTGECVASCGGDAVSITLKKSTSEQCIPQAFVGAWKDTVISVIPCWNGVVVQSGIQSGDELGSKSGAFVPYKAGEGLFDHAPEISVSMGGGGLGVKTIKLSFDPKNPAPIIIDNKDVVVDLGNSNTPLTVVAENCGLKMAYAPLFFPPLSRYIHAIRGSLPSSQYVYNYKIYPVWTTNGTDRTLEDKTDGLLINTGIQASSEQSNIFKAEYVIRSERSTFYDRNTLEIFGCIIEMEEQVSSVYQNSSGSQSINNKSDYIKNVTVSNSLSASSGNMMIDWYGYSQSQKYQQEVGSIRIGVDGWQDSPNSVPNSATLFTGYTWSANETKSPSGYDVNVSLVGVEKRLDDVHLIVPPIFDGYYFSEVAQYICQAAGVSYDFSQANNCRLAMSTDINSVLYNLSTGVSCRNALEMICKDCANRYFPSKDGKLVFYALESDGYPKYGNSKVFSFDGIEIGNHDLRPDFDNIRNYVVLIALRKNKEKAGKNFPDGWIPIPITSIRRNSTNPEIPWQRAICYTLPGFLEAEELDLISETLARSTKKYELLGSVTLPGLEISPLDKLSISDSWGSQQYWVVSVNQNVDLERKSWTTSVEIML